DTVPAHELGELLVKGPPDAATVAAWLRRFFVSPGQAVELRVIFKNGGVANGYFDSDHVGDMADQAPRRSQEAGVKGAYFTINPLKPEVLGRAASANRVHRAGRGDGASEADVARRAYLFVDCDPRRPPGLQGRPATDDEKARAGAKASQVRRFLTG